MGLIVDTNVFIQFERQSKEVDFSTWSGGNRVYISAVTVSELLMGVHRADSEKRRRRRSEFVEAVLNGVEVLAFTVECARVHAPLLVELAAKGQLIGAHDLIIAATALHHQHAVLTDNTSEFSRIPGLTVISSTPS